MFIATATILAAVLSASPAATSPQSGYASAYQAAVRSSRPLVVLIGASWCGPCQQVKRNCLADLKKKGEFAYLDADSDPIVKKLEVRQLPTVIVSELKDGQLWPIKRLVGFESISHFCKGAPK